jgi:hypothetical protein
MSVGCPSEEGRSKKQEARSKKQEARKIIRPFLIVNYKCIGAFMQPQYNEGAGKQLRRQAKQFRAKALYHFHKIVLQLVDVSFVS